LNYTNVKYGLKRYQLFTNTAYNAFMSYDTVAQSSNDGVWVGNLGNTSTTFENVSLRPDQ